jgi:hypothetical protein
VSKLNPAGSALVYSTYLGGSGGNRGSGIAVDASGSVYVTGTTQSSDFPTTPGAVQTTYGSGDDSDPFVSKLNPTGSGLVYSTYLGAGNCSNGCNGNAIAVDAIGNAYVAGMIGSGSALVSKLNSSGTALVYTSEVARGATAYGLSVDASSNTYVTGMLWAGCTTDSFVRTTPGAFQTTCVGGQEAFVSKLNPAGILVYGTFLAGSGDDRGNGIAVDTSGNAYVTGTSASSDFPTTPDAFQTNCCGAFVTKMNSTGTALIYSTFLGEGSGAGIAVDASGDAFVTGGTGSSNFPTSPGAFQTVLRGYSNAFLSKLDSAGSALIYSTYLGGSGGWPGDSGFGAVLDGSGSVYVAGRTNSPDFPITPGAFQTAYRAAQYNTNALIAKISFVEAPGLALGPANLTFHQQVIGTTSTPQTATLLDAGSQALGITSILASGDFAQTSTCGSAVQPGVPCTLSVTFKPTTPGTRYGAITITDNAPGSPHRLSLTGTAVSGVPAVGLKPTSLTFGPQTVGTTSYAQPATLKNMGSGPLTITSIASTGDFAQTNNCRSTLAPSGSCTLTVTFTPTTSGTRAGTVTVTDNAPGSPHQVLLTGTGGVAPVVTLTPASLTFPAQALGTTSPAQPATLKNTGNAVMNISNIVPSGDFVQTNNCGSSVQPGASCTLNVSFKPTANGTRTGAVTITDNAPGSPQQLLLIGAGGTGPAASLTPTSLVFAAQVGTFSPVQLAVLKNIGAAPLKITGIGRSGDFYEGTNCPTNLVPNASCTLSVTFTPTSAGTRSGAVTIWDNAPGSPHKLSLSGTGSGAGNISLRLSPTSLSFGSVAVGTPTNPQTVTLTNTGAVAASFLDPFGFSTTGTNWSDFHKNPHCGTSLAPKASCQVSVFFKPTARGARTGFFLVRQGAASVQIPLSGTGL